MTLWPAKLDIIREATNLALHDLSATNHTASARFADEEQPAFSDPDVTLALDDIEELYTRESTTEDGNGDLVPAMSTVEQCMLTVRVETVNMQQVQSAVAVASQLRQRFRESAVRAKLAEGDILLVGKVGPMLSRPYMADNHRVHAYLFEVPMRTEVFNQDPDATGIFTTIEIDGELEPGPITVDPFQVSE